MVETQDFRATSQARTPDVHHICDFLASPQASDLKLKTLFPPCVACNQTPFRGTLTHLFKQNRAEEASGLAQGEASIDVVSDFAGA